MQTLKKDNVTLRTRRGLEFAPPLFGFRGLGVQGFRGLRVLSWVFVLGTSLFVVRFSVLVCFSTCEVLF